MKIFLKIVTAVMLLSSASMNLQAAISKVSSNHDQRLQKQSPSNSESVLQQVRVNSRLQAAEAAYNLSILAVNRRHLNLAHSLIEESIQLNQSNPKYLRIAADIAFLTQHYDKAITYQMLLLEIARSASGFDELQVPKILDQLGAIYVRQEHYEKARSSYQESLHLREKLPGDNHLQVSMSLNRLASLAILQDQSLVAETLLKKSIDITREIVGPRHVDTANMLVNLADLYQREARLEEAETLYKDALAIWDDSPVDPLRQAVVQNSLGRLFKSQRRFADARLQFEQVLLLLKQNYTQEHPFVQQAIRNLTELDSARSSYLEKDHIYDERLRQSNSRLPEYKVFTADADNTPALPEQRIMRF